MPLVRITAEAVGVTGFFSSRDTKILFEVAHFSGLPLVKTPRGRATGHQKTKNQKLTVGYDDTEYNAL